MRPRIATGRNIKAQAHIESLQVREAMKLKSGAALDGIGRAYQNATDWHMRRPPE